MTPEELGARHPRLFHLAHAGSWPGIERHGLLSTESLLDLFEVRGKRRADLLTRRRPDSVPIEHPEHGRAVIRDQKPLSEHRLAACLRDGLTPARWLRTLNAKAFFWVDPERLVGFRNARACRRVRQLVITVDAAPLVRTYADRVLLSDRNTGSTSPFAHERGRDTFLPLRENGPRRIVELAVEGGVPDIRKYVIRAAETGGGEPDLVLFENAARLAANITARHSV